MSDDNRDEELNELEEDLNSENEGENFQEEYDAGGAQFHELSVKVFQVCSSMLLKSYPGI